MRSLVQTEKRAGLWSGGSWFRKFTGLSRVRDATIAAFGMIALVAGGAGSASAAVCGTTQLDLTAGQTIDVGSVIVENDEDFIYVTYKLDYPGATFEELHLWIGSKDPLDPFTTLPKNPQGVPQPGQFPFKFDASGLTEYTFKISWDDPKLSIHDVSKVCGLKIYIVAHAEVKVPDGKGGFKNETAWAGDKPGNTERWWFYAEYKICCPEEPPVLASCETAFAKGTHVFTTDPKSNPDGLPSLKLTKNRWGWAIKVKVLEADLPFVNTYDIWAGAGLNNTAKGTLVGELKVEWDGTELKVTYELDDGYYMTELHLYAEGVSPTTLAPGQYGHTDYFDPPVQKKTVTLSQDYTSELWIIAHAVVCTEGEVVKTGVRK